MSSIRLVGLLLSCLALTAVAQDVIVRRPLPARPEIKAFPRKPGTPHTDQTARDPARICTVPSSADASADAAPSILSAFQECNKGGTVVLDGHYTISTPLDLTFLEAVDFVISGNVTFGPNVKSWVEHSFKFAYQNASAFWLIGGKDVSIYGGGLIDGNGFAWWDAMKDDKLLLRPILFAVDGLQSATISQLRMINSPATDRLQWFNLIANSSDILVNDIDIRLGKNPSGEKPRNTDGWDTFRSDGVTIQNSFVHNNDDCVSFKPNSTNMVIQNLTCISSHGISVGSLGQYVDSYDVVENITVSNCFMSNGSDAARIKVWPGTFTAFQSLLNGGGGSGHVNNVTFDGMRVTDTDMAIQLTQCYGTKDQKICNDHPSNLTISNVNFRNIWGVTSAKYDPRVGSLVCSAPDRCANITVQNLHVLTPSRKPQILKCENLDKSLSEADCE